MEPPCCGVAHNNRGRSQDPRLRQRIHRGTRKEGTRVIAETVFVGTELLLGQILNTNGAYLGQRLGELGIDQYFQATVGDNPLRLEETLRRSLERADVVITSGGLGPTQDDLTRETAAALAGRALRFDAAIWEGIARGRQLKENMKRQAMVPEGATVLPNAVGTAPGLLIPAGPDGDRALILLPGPPSELVPMFENHVIPYLLSRMGQPAALVSRSLRFYEVGESAIADALEDLITSQTDPTLATYAKPGDVELRISTKAADPAAGLARIAPLEAEIRRRLGQHVYGVDDITFEAAVGRLAASKGRSIGVIDAWTGGVLAHRLAEPPDHARWLRAALTLPTAADARAWLQEVWPNAGLEPDEAGRSESDPGGIAVQLARAALRLGSPVGVGVIGTEPAPATAPRLFEATVHVGLCAGDGRERAHTASLRGRRSDIHHRASQSALIWLYRFLQESAPAAAAS